MKACFLLALLFLLFSVGTSATDSARRVLVGWVTDTHCGAKGANEKHAECARKCVKEAGAEFALYVSADNKLYVIEPRNKIEGFAGQQVKVEGIMDGNRFRISAIQPLSAK